ncbi:MAG TPA: hypothetical protein VJ995_04080 [Geothermobacteraceae bacterium]|nr:hypothetical protein [Geothermobacteraceae bacterium]
METSVKTKAETLIDQLMQQLDPDSARYHVLASARQFKSSWVDLGEKLLKVKREGLFAEWGYQDFLDYCRKEVRIKQPTAQKLTMAYRYLEQKQPNLLQQGANLHPLPDYRSVDLLRHAEEEQQLSQDEISQLRHAVLSENRSFPTVRQRFNQTCQSHRDSNERRKIALQAALSASRRLGSALQSVEDLKGMIAGPLEELIANLEAELQSKVKGEEG